MAQIGESYWRLTTGISSCPLSASRLNPPGIAPVGADSDSVEVKTWAISIGSTALPSRWCYREVDEEPEGWRKERRGAWTAADLSRSGRGVHYPESSPIRLRRPPQAPPFIVR